MLLQLLVNYVKLSATFSPRKYVARIKTLSSIATWLSPTIEARDQKSNLYAYEMTPNPCARGGGVVVDNGPSSGGEVSIYQIYTAWQPCCLCIQLLVDYWQQRHYRQNYEPCFAPKSDAGFSRLPPLEIGLLVSSLHAHQLSLTRHSNACASYQSDLADERATLGKFMKHSSTCDNKVFTFREAQAL